MNSATGICVSVLVAGALVGCDLEEMPQSPLLRTDPAQIDGGRGDGGSDWEGVLPDGTEDWDSTAESGKVLATHLMPFAESHRRAHALANVNVTLDLGACVDVSGSWLLQTCQTFCETLVEYALDELFEPGATCPIACVEVLLEKPDYLPNFLCVAHMQEHHFFSDCWWPKPLQALPECTEFCTNLGQCGLHEAMTMPADPCLCEASCTGFYAMQGSSASQRLECATESLANSCDLEEMFHCSEILDDCPARCQELAQLCPGEGGLHPLFDSTEACVAKCKTYTPEQFFALEQCVAATSCTHPEYCSVMPESPLPSCVESCGLFFELCPGLPVEPDECVWACSGVSYAIPDGVAEALPQCLGELDQCPDDPLGVLAVCFTDPCEGACQEPDSCPAESEYSELFASAEECQEVCQTLTNSQASTFATCLAWAGCQGASHCLTTSEPMLSDCQSYCTALSAVCSEEVPFPMSACPAVCSGIVKAVPVADPVYGVDCLATHGNCPATPESAIYGCFVATGEECTSRCLKASTCGLTEDWACKIDCELEKELSPVWFEQRTNCVAEAFACVDIAACLGDAT